MTIDNADLRYKKPSEEIIRDLIWYSVGFQIPPNMVTFGPPEAFEPYPNDPIQRNTVVTTKGIIKDTRYFRGEQRIRYRRLPLEDLEPVSDKKIEVKNYPFTTYQILDQINEIYGIMLSYEDVEDVECVDAEAPVILIAKSNSLVWIGELIIDEKYINYPIVTVTDLNGFKKFEFSINENLANKNLHGFLA